MDPRRIVFAVFDGLQSLDLTGPWEVFAGASAAAASSGRAGDDEKRRAAYELTAASVGGAPVRSSSGLALAPGAALESIDTLDTLVVVGGTGTRPALADEPLIAEIARLAARAERVASVCTGAFLLAEAGLLDGRRVATHWAWAGRLAELYPAVDVDPEPVYVRDGELITSAGVTAGIDLALALVEEDLGPAVALAIARDLVVYARRPGGQAQFSVQLAHQTAERRPLRELQAWMGEHPDADLSVAALAGRLHLSERHFSRIFRSELGIGPAAYVERLRVEVARRLLEDSEAGLEQIAARCGFGSAEVMRRAFRRLLSTSPRAYRERFRMAAVSGGPADPDTASETDTTAVPA